MNYSDESKSNELKKVAFLDTNTLHYIGLYLEYAKENTLYPMGEKLTEEDKVAAKERVSTLNEKNLKEGLNRGLETVYVLLTKDVETQYAPVSEIELLTGKIRGRAIQIAADEGVPDRMWSDFREKEISARVGRDDMAEIKMKVDGLSTMLEESGVAVKTDTRERAVKETMDLAKVINGLVYMSAMDSIIYASALVAQADYLFTADEYFRKTVNKIQLPHAKSPYKYIRKQLCQFVRTILFVKIDDDNEVLPSAHQVKANGRIDPPLPPSGDERK